MTRLPKEITTTILLAIFNKGELTMTQLQKETGFSTITVLNHVEGLLTADLLEERREKELPKRRFLRLSREGSRVASVLNLLINSRLDAKGCIELGAKVGRMSAYREGAKLLRQQNVTRDYVIAEYLVRDLEFLSEALTILSSSLPPELDKHREALDRIREKLVAKVAESRGYLQKNDIKRAAEMVAAAWKEYEQCAKSFRELSNTMKDRKLDELEKVVDFVTF